MKFLIACITIMASMTGTALASSSEWHETQGGRVRLVTSGAPDAEGRLKGVLQIELEPGWKTYWRDPGGSGVPPSIDVSANPMVAHASIEFPPPEHHFDGTSTWAGYGRSVDLPVTFQMRASGATGPIDGIVFLGICETICVPVQARLTVDPAVAPDEPADVAIVQAAVAALPAPSTPDFRVEKVTTSDKQVFLEVRAPADADKIDLFLAGGEGYMFGPPKPVQHEGKINFAADIVTRPKTPPAGPGLHYTLVTATGSVAGLVPYF